MKGWAAMDKNRQILKIKNKKVDGRANIFISWQERTSAEKSWDDYTLRCDEMARPEFYKALEALKEHVTQICELPDEYEGRMTPSGVSFSYDKDGGNIWSAVITAQMKLDYNPAPLNIVTPYKSNAVPENCDEDYALSLECQMALKILETEAFAYINGDRAQGSLFDDDKGKDEGKEKSKGKKKKGKSAA